MRFTLLTLLIATTGTGCMNARGPVAGILGGSDPLAGPRNSGFTPPTTPTASDTLPGKQSAELCLVMAESLERTDKEIDAIAYYEKAREQDPTVAERAARRLAVLYDRTDQQAKAMNEYQELLKKRPKDATLLNDVGYSLYNRGQWTEAETYLLRAVAADKTNKRAWVNLGMAQAQQGKAAEAIRSFEKAVSPAEAQANLGFVLLTRGNKPEALAAYRRALELEPTLPVAQTAVAKLEGQHTPPDAAR
jgi:Tfp pilus assembly protein PilF